ncbi:hypothetical protein [Variovorax sp. EBFNA2]|uniref:hypothetical protein n=1 Tax=Variovorax sp. EBFNA2 TaxID=3342097 RepID=UPI0029BFDA99|nr:hypothetical protein [Variovorax boronicumulans]WPG41139.1 hypothetical protein RZE79_34180 [Variovorax boronicumulans]
MSAFLTRFSARRSPSIERRPGSGVSVQAIHDFSKTRIARYKKPKHLFFVDVLPRNGAGKVRKAELRELARERVAFTDLQA